MNMQNLENGYILKGSVCDFRCKEGYKSMLPTESTELVCVKRVAAGMALKFVPTRPDSDPDRDRHNHITSDQMSF
jgi:hypothetical protein